jgi:hypothetical protein
MAARPYKKLPGRGSGALNLATLWEGEDHLLLVESHRVSESYKRFFYRDIHALVVCQTKTGLVISIVLAVLTLLFAIPAFFVGPEGAIALGIIAGIFLLLTALNFLAGPTCRCTLRTAVQTQPLASLGRIRNARKTLARLQPRIAAAQPQPPPPTP